MKKQVKMSAQKIAVTAMITVMSAAWMSAATPINVSIDTTLMQVAPLPPATDTVRVDIDTSSQIKQLSNDNAQSDTSQTKPLSNDITQSDTSQIKQLSDDTARPDSTEIGELSESGVDSDSDFETDSDSVIKEEAPALDPRARLQGIVRADRTSGRLDGIAAVVGDEIILLSEVEAYTYMRLAAMGADADLDTIDGQRLLRESLDDLIDNKVMLVRAADDSTIHVRSDEVESTLNNHINMILRQNGITMEQLEAQLRIQQGTTFARFRAEARRAIREQLLKQKLQQSYYFSTRVNRRDVERFYEEYSDSLPAVGESFEMLKLSLKLASSDSVRQAAFDKIRDIKRLLDAGENFEELAKMYSESPEGPSGGDLGYLSKGSTTEIVFEERAFTLPVGQISEPFETRLGFHIIVVEEKRDLRVKLRQILVRHMPTERQREAVAATLDSLRLAITSKAGFEAAARAMSADAATRPRGGELGWVSLLEMPSAMRGAVQNLDEGQISAPVDEDGVISIYMMHKRVDSRKLTLENDYPLIADKARDIHAQKRLLDGVKRWRERVFIDVRI